MVPVRKRMGAPACVVRPPGHARVAAAGDDPLRGRARRFANRNPAGAQRDVPRLGDSLSRAHRLGRALLERPRAARDADLARRRAAMERARPHRCRRDAAAIAGRIFRAHGLRHFARCGRGRRRMPRFLPKRATGCGRGC